MARDLIHNAVKQALINDNWVITDDPFELELVDDDKELAVDLGAEKLISAARGTQQILVEIKTFGGTSILYKFHEALGQYLDYQAAIEEANIQRKLFIGISTKTHSELAKINFIQRRIDQYGLKFVVVDIETETIEQWIS